MGWVQCHPGQDLGVPHVDCVVRFSELVKGSRLKPGKKESPLDWNLSIPQARKDQCFLCVPLDSKQVDIWDSDFDGLGHALLGLIFPGQIGREHSKGEEGPNLKRDVPRENA